MNEKNHPIAGGTLIGVQLTPRLAFYIAYHNTRNALRKGIDNNCVHPIENWRNRNREILDRYPEKHQKKVEISSLVSGFATLLPFGVPTLALAGFVSLISVPSLRAASVLENSAYNSFLDAFNSYHANKS